MAGSQRVGRDDPIKGIFRPCLFEGFSNHPGEGMWTNRQANFRGEIRENPVAIQRDPANFMEVFQFQKHNRADHKILGIQSLKQTGGKPLDFPGMQPEDHMRVESDHGFHSPDQSICTRSAALPLIVGRRRSLARREGGGSGMIRIKRPFRRTSIDCPVRKTSSRI